MSSCDVCDVCGRCRRRVAAKLGAHMREGLARAWAASIPPHIEAPARAREPPARRRSCRAPRESAIVPHCAIRLVRAATGVGRPRNLARACARALRVHGQPYFYSSLPYRCALHVRLDCIAMPFSELFFSLKKAQSFSATGRP